MQQSKSKRTAAASVAAQSLESRWLLSGITIIDANESSMPSHLVDVSGTLLFTATDAQHGQELWKSNGTEAGTTIVKDIRPGPKGILESWDQSLGELVNVNGVVYFTADDGVHGIDVWKSDGTEAGTVLLKDLNASASSGAEEYPQQLTSAGGRLYFVDVGSDQGFWSSDGTTAGTVRLAGISPTLSSVVSIDDGAYFPANDGAHGFELWKSNGTVSGTKLVKDITPGGSLSDAGPSNLTIVNGVLYFTADDATHGRELWKTDGTLAGTLLVNDIYPGTTGASPAILASIDDTLYFTADDGTHGRELWKTDGTSVGTTLVKDLTPGVDATITGDALAMDGVLYFSADDGSHGTSLWKSDGTANGTTLVKTIGDDLDPAASEPAPGLVAAGDAMYMISSYSGDAGMGYSWGWALWKSDGTASGTRLLYDTQFDDSYVDEVLPIDDKLYLSAAYDLWKSDGTVAGTGIIKDINPTSDVAEPTSLTNVNGTLFFSASDGVHGRELWKSDGTEAGTQLVKDIYSPGRRIVVDGEPGDDTVLITEVGNTLNVTLNGKTESHEITGDTRVEVSTFSGSDEIDLSSLTVPVLVNGGPGNDFVRAGWSNDTLAGADGNDSIFGAAGKDRIDGGDGADLLVGNGGNDRLIGGAGRDRLYGRLGADYLDAGPGNDRVFGGEGNDVLYGGTGDDTLSGDEGVDRIVGNKGGDSIFSRDGNAETIDGSDGDDSVQSDPVLDVLLRVENSLT